LRAIDETAQTSAIGKSAAREIVTGPADILDGTGVSRRSRSGATIASDADRESKACAPFDHLSVNSLRDPRVIGFRGVFARIMGRVDPHEFDALSLICERRISNR
jgi:hypothetical protein